MGTVEQTQKTPVWKLLWKDRKLIAAMTKTDFKARYAGTAFGMLWAVAQPLVTVLVYVFVFAVGFKSAPVQDVPYVLWLMCALVPWLYFSDILTGCTTSLLEYAHLIKKTVFPARILPLVRAGSAGFIHGVFATLLWLAFLIAGEPLSLYAVQGYYFSTCTMLLGLGLGYLTASLAPFFKDIAQTVGILLQIGFWVTPIAWSPEIMSPTIQTVLRINPMFYIVQGWRDSFIGGVGIWERPLWALYFWLVTAAIWTAAIILFKKFRPHYADVL